MNLYKIVLGFGLQVILLPVWGQERLVLTTSQADSMFLANNLELLAQQYKTDMNKAATIQASLFNNPSFSSEWNLYNPQKKKYFDWGNNGQQILAVEQVIHLAGQRNKRIQLARENETYGMYEFYDLLRTLKYELRVNLQTCYFNKLTINKFDEQLNLLDTIIQALSYQSKKGNIPPKEVLRLQAVYYQLNTDRRELMLDLLEARKNLQTLLHTNATIDIVLSKTELKKYQLPVISKDSILQLSLKNRPDLQMMNSQLKQQQLNYELQRKLAYPDMHIGAVYDQAGSYVNKYSGITLGFDLPVWNRNQGNIKMAKAGVGYAETLRKQKETELQAEVSSTWQKLNEVEREYQKVETGFSEKFDEINDGFILNFHKRNISMLEFVDFFESYNQSILQLNKLTEKRLNMYEELNYTVGQELFHE